MLEAVVQAAAEGATVFFSTHQISEVERIADHVFILNAGRLAFEGSLEDMREKYRRMHIVFPGRPPLEEMRLEGVRKANAEGHVLSLVANGNLEAITGRAHALGALSINVHPINLREMFLESVAEDSSDLV